MKVSLRKYQESDIPRLVELGNNKAVSRYLLRFPYPYQESDAKFWIAHVSQLDSGTCSRVIENDKGEFVGAVGATRCENGMAEIGYWIGEPYWGQGLASAALAKFIGHCFQQLGYKKLFATVLDPNKASMRVLEKCGFQEEGVQQEQQVCKDGKRHDVHRFVICC